jgi:enterochelin esterase family protein
VQEFRIPRPRAPFARRVWVYTPPEYESGRDTVSRLMFVFDGEAYLEEIPLPRMLDSLLAAGKSAPTIAVLIDDSTSTARLDELANRAWFAKHLAEDILPWVRSHWRVPRDPHRVILAGSSAGGLAAAYIALARPAEFGNVLSQSGAFWRGNEASNEAPWEWVTGQVRSGPRRDVRFWLDVGALETRGALGGAAPSILEANRRLVSELRAKKYDVTYTEVPNGFHAPESWKVRLPAALVALTSGAR